MTIRTMALQQRQRLYIEVSDQRLAYIDDLVATGLYGANRADACRTLIARGIEQAISSGIIAARPVAHDPNQPEFPL